MNNNALKISGLLGKKGGYRIPGTALPATVVLTVFSLSSPGFAVSAPAKALDGVSHYRNQEYDKAAKSFLEAGAREPGNAAIAYNLGNSYYKAGKFAEAAQAYSKSAAGNGPADLKQKSAYNIGNALFRLGKLQESADAYKKALELNPDDMDAKFNLEFVREQLEKQKPREQRKKPEPDSQPDKNRNERADDGSGPNADQKSAGGDESREPPDEGKTGNSATPEPPGESQPHRDNNRNPTSEDAGNARIPEDKRRTSAGKWQPPFAVSKAELGKATLPITSKGYPEMSKDEAEQWLGGLHEDQKQFRRGQMDKRAARPVYQGKDW